ncbi:MAG: hypothetical protein WA240_12150 [Nitrospirota bacterium]
MTIKNCIKCDKLSSELWTEKKILVNSIYLDIEKDVNKDCEECLERASKKPQELARVIAKKPEIRRKNYIIAALKERPFEYCEIERHENIPINEIGPMNGMLMGIDLSEPIGDFFLFRDHVKDKYQDKYKEIVDMKCFKENENMMIEFPIVLVTPPNRGIKYPVNGIKYYVEDGNHRLLKWIDSGNKTVPAFVIIDPEYAP